MRHSTRLSAIVCALGALLAGGCDLNLQNPNAPTEDEALSSVDGVIAVAVGLQAQYNGSVADFLVPPSLVTDEWGTETRSLIAYQSLLTGQNFDASYGVVLSPWADAYRVVKTANSLILHAPQVGLGSGLQAGILSLARLYKAMALGTILMDFDQVPIDVSVPGPVPQPRAVVLDTVLALLDAARTDLVGVPDADLAGFNTRVKDPGLNLRETIDAMRARFALMAGQYQSAIDAADSVDLTVLSTFTYPSPARNPVNNLAFGLLYVGGLKSFVDSAEAGDLRPAYWLDTTATPFTGNPDSLMYPLRKFSGNNDPFPAYLPDEMRLIKAEAFTMLGTLDSAAFYVNAVRTRTASTLDEPVAGLTALDPATQLDTPAKLLAQIAYNRRYSLYMQGLRWEDTRRLGSAITTTPTLSVLPIPTQECDANPSNPCP
jgi:starch-binding outer membrane protein, SusD/RagB family